MTVQFEYKPQGKVLEEWGRDRHQVSVIRGPLGSGKSWRAIFRMVELCAEQLPNKEGIRKTHAAVIRKTYPEITSSILKDVREIIPKEMGRLTMGHPPQLELNFMLEDNTQVEATIQFLALDKPEDANKVRGMNIVWAWLNEVNLISENVFRMVLARTDRYRPGFNAWAGIFADANPWDQDHWLQKLCDEQVRDPTLYSNYAFFVQPGALIKVDGKWRTNPDAENQVLLKRGYAEKLIAGAREDWIRINLGNELGYAYDGKPVHPDYSDKLNVAVEPLTPTPGRMVYVGLDFGLDPSAVFWQRQDSGQWWGFDEIARHDMHNDAFARELKARCAKWRTIVPGLMFKFIGDPSGDNRSMTDGRTTFQIYRTHGINVIPASSNDPQLRRTALDRPLTRTVDGGKPGLLLSPHMSNLRKALAGKWCYRRVQIGGTERYKDEADKNEYSHIGEAAEYALMDAGEHQLVNNGDAHSANWEKYKDEMQKRVVSPRGWDVFGV